MISSPANNMIFIADVHLPPQADALLTKAFLQFMQTTAKEADALYILGDLFDGWLGDDIGIIAYATVIQALSDYTRLGKALYVGLGNRDFLLKAAFAQATGATLLDDETEIQLDGNNKAVLLHGDTLCTDDTAYLTMRAIMFNPAWQAEQLKKSATERIAIAQQLRDASSSEKQNKQEAIMDVTTMGVSELVQRHPTVNHIIHGHTHRPMKHSENTSVTRWVLGDWRPQAIYLQWKNNQLALQTFLPD